MPDEPSAADDRAEGMGAQLQHTYDVARRREAGEVIDADGMPLATHMPVIGSGAALGASLITGGVVMTSAQLKAELDDFAEKRRILNDWLRANLTPGRDFGCVHRKVKQGYRDYRDCRHNEQSHMADGDGNLIACPDCGAMHSLWKPGAEKVISFFKCVARYKHDVETQGVVNGFAGYEGKATQAICYVCYAEHLPTQRILSEGRGAAELGDHQNKANTTIKMSKKRAMVDCALGFGLSDVFTQDIETVADYAEGPKPVPDVGIPPGPFAGWIARFTKVGEPSSKGTRREFLVKGQPGHFRFVTRSNIEKYKEKDDKDKEESRNFGEGKPFTCVIGEIAEEGEHVWFKCDKLRHPSASDAVPVPGFNWQEAANDVTGEASPAPAGPPSASAPPAEGRVHTARTATDDDSNCVEFWQPHIRGLIKKLPAKYRAHVPADWETWTGVGELERLGGRLLDYIAEDES